MIAYVICLSLSDLLHLERSSLGPLVLPQMALFHSFFFYDWVIFHCISVSQEDCFDFLTGVHCRPTAPPPFVPSLLCTAQGESGDRREPYRCKTAWWEVSTSVWLQWQKLRDSSSFNVSCFERGLPSVLHAKGQCLSALALPPKLTLHGGWGGREWKSSLRMTGGHLVLVFFFFNKKWFISGVLI